MTGAVIPAAVEAATPLPTDIPPPVMPPQPDGEPEVIDLPDEQPVPPVREPGKVMPLQA